MMRDRGWKREEMVDDKRGELELERSPRSFAAARLTLTNGTESNPTTGGGL